MKWCPILYQEKPKSPGWAPRHSGDASEPPKVVERPNIGNNASTQNGGMDHDVVLLNDLPVLVKALPYA